MYVHGCISHPHRKPRLTYGRKQCANAHGIFKCEIERIFVNKSWPILDPVLAAMGKFLTELDS